MHYVTVTHTQILSKFHTSFTCTLQTQTHHTHYLCTFIGNLWLWVPANDAAFIGCHSNPRLAGIFKKWVWIVMYIYSYAQACHHGPRMEQPSHAEPQLWIYNVGSYTCQHSLISLCKFLIVAELQPYTQPLGSDFIWLVFLCYLSAWALTTCLNYWSSTCLLNSFVLLLIPGNAEFLSSFQFYSVPWLTGSLGGMPDDSAHSSVLISMQREMDKDILHVKPLLSRTISHKVLDIPRPLPHSSLL